MDFIHILNYIVFELARKSICVKGMGSESSLTTKITSITHFEAFWRIKIFRACTLCAESFLFIYSVCLFSTIKTNSQIILIKHKFREKSKNLPKIPQNQQMLVFVMIPTAVV